LRLLLDTHAFLWWLAGDRKMSRRARQLVAATETECLVSAASAWEITTKVRLGKLPGVEVIARDVGGAIASQGFGELPIRVLHAQWAGTLPSDHRDPFDRMLAAQAHVEGVPLLSIDTVFDALGVPRIW
jgi:PIN domain nuclease of toxin-antitoxin system